MTETEKEINPDTTPSKDSGENVKITLSINSSLFGNITTTFQLIGCNEPVDTRYIMEALKDVCCEITKKMREVKHEDKKQPQFVETDADEYEYRINNWQYRVWIEVCPVKQCEEEKKND